MNLRLSTIANISLCLSIFLISLLIGPLYVDGDQYAYRITYEGLKGLNVVDGFIFYTFNLSSKEFIHFFLSWGASNLEIKKDLFIAFSNTILAYGVIMLLRKWKVSFFVIALLLLTNFYFFVLYFAAERLKFGFIFFIFSLLYVRFFHFFALLSVTSHIQLLIFYISILFQWLSEQIIIIVSRGIIKKSLKIIVILILLIGLFVILGEHILKKFLAYSHGTIDVSGLLKSSIFFVLSLIYSKNKREVIFLFIPLVVGIILIGGDRINMMGYFVFLYYALPVKNGINFGILITSTYFIFASFEFVIKIMEYGNGFYLK